MALVKCENCFPHVFQDRKYGDKIRVANRRQKDGKHLGWRCTVCERTLDKAVSE